MSSNLRVKTTEGGSLKRSALLSEVEWIGDGFSPTIPIPIDDNRDEAATQLLEYYDVLRLHNQPEKLKPMAANTKASGAGIGSAV